jgi:hypothetical protein
MATTCECPACGHLHRPLVVDQRAAAPCQEGRQLINARYYWLLLAESRLTRRLVGSMLRRIWALPVPTG